MEILIVVYAILGFWSTKYTIYYNKFIIEWKPGDLFMRRLVYGFLFGWILIPVALFRKFILKK